MSHSFGDLLNQYRARKYGLSQARLAEAIGYAPTIITKMCKGGKELTGPSGRERVTRIIGALHGCGALLTLDEANALLAAADMPPLYAGSPVEADLIHSLPGSNTNHAAPAIARAPVNAAVHLPAQLTSFVGREHEVAELVERVKTARLVTLVGAGGCGKTRLALEIATRAQAAFEDGARFVEFAPIADPALVPRALADALGVTEQGNRLLTHTLIDHLATKQVLLILDNCEHLIAAGADLAEQLLRGCPRINILATSREALRISAEVAWHVPPLPQDDAACLFVERAQAVQPAFDATAHRAAIAQMCRHLDGIPLAIELAAAQTQAMTAEEMAARLDDRFHLLTEGDRTASPRHRTLRAMLDWSYDLLSAPEQTLLNRLSVFAGGWTVEAAEVVCADDDTPRLVVGVRRADILPILLKLARKSLVVAQQNGERTRYHLLETVRQYASGKLQAMGEAERIRDQHLNYFLSLAERRDEPFQAYRTHVQHYENFQQNNTEHDNFRAALSWVISKPDDLSKEQALRLSGALTLFWVLLGYLSEGRNWLTTALSNATTPTMRAARSRTLSRAGWIASLQGDYALAETWLGESLPLLRAGKDSLELARALYYLSGFRVNQNPADALPMLEECAAISSEFEMWGLTAEATRLMGEATIRQQLWAQARDFFKKSKAMYERLNDPYGIAKMLGHLAIFAWRDGDLHKARIELELSLKTLQANQILKWHVPRLLGFLGRLLCEQGDYAHARAVLEECHVCWRDMGVKRSDLGGTAEALVKLGRVALFQGDLAQASSDYGESLKQFREAGDQTGSADALLGLGDVALARGEWASASMHFKESLTLFQALGDAPGVTLTLAGLAGALLRQGQLAQAARLTGAASALQATIDLSHTHPDLSDYDRTAAAVRLQLDDGGHQAAWAEGRAMTPEQAIAYALGNE